MCTGTRIIFTIYVASLVCCVGSNFCDRLVVHPEECYRVCLFLCVCLCVTLKPQTRRFRLKMGSSATKVSGGTPPSIHIDISLRVLFSLTLKQRHRTRKCPATFGGEQGGAQGRSVFADRRNSSVAEWIR